MEENLSYTATDYITVISVDKYLSEYYDKAKFQALCAQCPNYGKAWTCPPFSIDTEARMRQYKWLLLTATKIIPQEKGLPISLSRKLIYPERVRLQRRLLEMEKEYGGLSLAYVGTCIYCAENEQCSRATGEPCRHPELARSSLESYGFDIGKTTQQLFDIPLVWGSKGEMPEYLTLVCGFFTNDETAKF
jgi:predicted metal-binding protein